MAAILFFFFEYFLVGLEEFLARHWNIRKTYQTSIYRFNVYHEYNLMCKECFQFNVPLDFRRLFLYTHIYYLKPFYLYSTIMHYLIIFHWYTYWWLFWVTLTVHLYFHPKVRDLGLAHEYYEYCSEIVVSTYRAIGPFLLFSWSLWTLVANRVFIYTIMYYLHEFFWAKYTWAYYYLLTL